MTTPEEHIAYGNEEGFKMVNELFTVFLTWHSIWIKNLGTNDFPVQWKASIDEAYNNLHSFYSLTTASSNYGGA